MHCCNSDNFMLRIQAFFAVVLIVALAPALFLGTASGQQKGGGKQAAPQGPLPPVLANYQPVTAQRLLKPEDGNWLMIRRTYDGWGYSPLDQITPANVARLQPAWVVSTGVTNGHEAAPIVNNGVMLGAKPGNQGI